MLTALLTVISLHIAPQPVVYQLLDFGRQARVDILWMWTPETTPGLIYESLRSLDGRYTIARALSTLLADTGLTWDVTPGGAVAIFYPDRSDMLTPTSVVTIRTSRHRRPPVPRVSDRSCTCVALGETATPWCADGEGLHYVVSCRNIRIDPQ